MASIYGVEVKNVKPFLDHEGLTIFRGSIYMDGKRIGTWCDNYMAGNSDFDVPEKEYKELVSRADKFYDFLLWEDGSGELFDAEPFKGDPDILISTLVKLREQEDSFKKCLKNGYKSMIVISGPYGQYDYWYLPTACASDEWKIKYKDQIEQSEKAYPAWHKAKEKYITNPDDFVIATMTEKKLVW